MTNDKLPEEIQRLIVNNAVLYADEQYLKRPTEGDELKEWGTIRDIHCAGATEWAPWKVKHDELQAKLKKLRLALVMAVFALKQSYDVTEYPADGQTNQDSAIRIGEEALQQFKDGTKEEEEKPEGWPFVCQVCGKQDCESDHK